MAAGDGAEAFSFLGHQRIDEAIDGFHQQTGITASVYVGSTRGRALDDFADTALGELPRREDGTVLLVVDPTARACLVRTDAAARIRIDDEACGLAVLSMTTSFAAGDLVGGVVIGLRMLGDSCAPPRIDLGRPEATSSTVTRGRFS